MTHDEICLKLDPWGRAQFISDIRKFGVAVVSVTENGSYRAVAFNPNTYEAPAILKLWDEPSNTDAGA